VVQNVTSHKTKSFLGGSQSSYGSVLADLDAPDRPAAQLSDRGLDSDISVGEQLFINNDDHF
jgi:hypothetical protein